MAAKLTAKQKSFIHHYIHNGYNGTQAAIDAGYSQHTACAIAHENLRKPYIEDYLKKK